MIGDHVEHQFICIMEIFIEDWMRAFRDSVKYSAPGPGNMKCRQLQTFRVFPTPRLPELATDNLGANICDKERPFFWSRVWAETLFNPNAVVWQFPLLYMFDMSSAIENAFAGKAKATHTFQIGVLDVWADDCAAGKCAGCGGRTINEIQIDTQRLLMDSLRFISGIVYGNDFGGAIPAGWYHKGYLDKLVLDAVIPAGDRSKHLIDAVQPLNKTIRCVHVERPTAKMYGTAIELALPTSACLTETTNWADIDWGSVPQNAGCRDCQ